MPPSREAAFNQTVHHPARRRKIISRSIKTILDYTGAVIALILFSPVMFWAAYKIKKEDGGDIFFCHTRIGKDLRPFRMYKFRTMALDAESRLAEMLKDEELRKEFEVSFKFKQDPRITKIGHFLRKTSIDELPQLFNVLKGEMSLVGPRPIVEREIELYYGEEIARRVFSVKPGLTGLWQVSGRNDVSSYHQRIQLDLQYIAGVGVWADAKIILKTIFVIGRGGGSLLRSSVFRSSDTDCRGSFSKHQLAVQILLKLLGGFQPHVGVLENRAQYGVVER